ncbi:MAG: hypothetical protein LBT66_07985, partial [Methanobrevibacter sp.]|nr:hypothetical protein [Candidatus Methanovirga meridionalis]
RIIIVRIIIVRIIIVRIIIVRIIIVRIIIVRIIIVRIIILLIINKVQTIGMDGFFTNFTDLANKNHEKIINKLIIWWKLNEK